MTGADRHTHPVEEPGLPFARKAVHRSVDALKLTGYPSFLVPDMEYIYVVYNKTGGLSIP